MITPAGPFDFTGKRVLVSGCSSGIGRAVAEELIELGASVTGVDRQAPKTSLTAFHQVDLGDPESVRSLETGLTVPFDALCNCAGMSGGGGDPLQIMKVNFWGTRALTDLVLAMMPPGGAVASVGSLGAYGWEQNADVLSDVIAQQSYEDGVAWCTANLDRLAPKAYNFSKQCVVYWSKARSYELAGRQIRCNTISPSVTDTPMLADSVKAVGREYLDQIPKPLGRVALAHEPARALIFLLSDAASYVTGQNLWVDGGYTTALDLGVFDASPRLERSAW